MKQTKISTNNKLTTTMKLRKKFALLPGRKMKIGVEGLKIIPLVTKEEIKANIGFLGTRGRLLKALREDKRRARER